MRNVRSARRPIAIAAVAAIAVSLTACSTGGTVMVDTDPDRPFALDGVSEVTQVAQLTGPDAINDTVSFGVAGTDLGSMVNFGDKTFFLFGDTFGERAPESIGGQGGLWRSNVMAWTTDDDPSDGISFDGWLADGIGLAGPIIEGDHDSNEIGGEVTKIPTYGFAVGEALYVSYMSVKRWGEPGAWDANYSALVRSDDTGKTWELIEGVQWPGESNFIQFATANVQEDGVEYVYFWSIPAGRFGGVQLMRVPADEASVESQDSYEYFVGADGAKPRWSSDMLLAETVLEGTIGELSVMHSTYLDGWIMAYSDAGNVYVREGITPWGPWGYPIEVISETDYPGVYSPYLNPRYVSPDGKTVYFTLSLWDPYNVFWFSAQLDRTP